MVYKAEDVEFKLRVLRRFCSQDTFSTPKSQSPRYLRSFPHVGWKRNGFSSALDNVRRRVTVAAILTRKYRKC